MIKTASRIADIEEYYFSKKLAEVRALDKPEDPVINLGIGSPDLPPTDKTVRALVQVAEQKGSHGYQSYKGIPSLRKSIADQYERVYNVTLDPESMILPLMGSKEGIMHISMAFLNDGDEALVPDPGYPTYASATKLAGGMVRPYSMKESQGWGIDIDSLSQQDLSRVKIMWVNFPHMPTGRVASGDELQALVDLARENEFLIVNDNPYSLILNDTPLSILSCNGAVDVAMELNSLSKSHNMAGWRIGWVAGGRHHIEAVLKVKSNMDSGMFLGLQQAAVEALKSDDLWNKNLNATYRRRKLLALRILDAMDCTYAEQQSGLFVWAKIADHVDDVETWVDRLLYEARVFVTPGFVFGKEGKRYVRISLCASEELLREALSRIEGWKLQNVVPVNKMTVV